MNIRQFLDIWQDTHVCPHPTSKVTAEALPHSVYVQRLPSHLL